MVLVNEALKYINQDNLNVLLKEDGYDLNMIEATDILNPIDSYNLIKRTSITWHKIIEAIWKNMDEKDISILKKKI